MMRRRKSSRKKARRSCWTSTRGADAILAAILTWLNKTCRGSAVPRPNLTKKSNRQGGLGDCQGSRLTLRAFGAGFIRNRMREVGVELVGYNGNRPQPVLRRHV